MLLMSGFIKNFCVYLASCGIVVLLLLRAGVCYSEVFILPENTEIIFQYEIALINFEGSFKIKSSIFDLDGVQPENSHFALSFDLGESKAGFFIATKAMLSKSVLYAQKYPEITFTSKKVKYANEQFKILGDLQIRGITKIVTLFVKPIGFNPKLLNKSSSLEFHISAVIDRDIFGASGYSGIVGNEIKLNSSARLIRNF